MASASVSSSRLLPRFLPWLTWMMDYILLLVRWNKLFPSWFWSWCLIIAKEILTKTYHVTIVACTLVWVFYLLHWSRSLFMTFSYKYILYLAHIHCPSCILFCLLSMTKSYYIALTVTNTESSSLGLPELRSQALLVMIYLRLYQQAFVLLSLPPQQIANNSSQCLASLLTAHLPFTRFLWPSTTVSDNGSPVVMWWVGCSGPAEVSWYWGNIFFSQFLTQRR